MFKEPPNKSLSLALEAGLLLLSGRLNAEN